MKEQKFIGFCSRCKRHSDSEEVLKEWRLTMLVFIHINDYRKIMQHYSLKEEPTVFGGNTMHELDGYSDPVILSMLSPECQTPENKWMMMDARVSGWEPLVLDDAR